MRRVLAVSILAIAIVCPATSQAGKEIQVMLGAAQVVGVRAPLRVAIGNPEVADVKQISDQELLITGKTLGATTLIVWDRDNRKDTSTVVVTAGRVAETMIQVDVQVMEIRQNEDKNLGLDWERLVGPAGKLSLLETTSPLTAIGTLERGKLDLLLKLLDEKGQGKVLARPKLLTLSGHKASFSSGGEIPVATVNATGQSNVEWKKYGVSLDVQPTAQNNGLVTVELRAEVSDADFTKQVQGNPSLKTRWASTVIQVQPETTVVIGGLLNETNQLNHQGLPVLSDIPILGYLFKSTRLIRENSELVIFVTPRLVGR
ncbi:MAG: pilus assembly protein N-terminal domain-containing protein [candidate division FCPU426 bacterium]